jgi:hypothetical protein
MIDLRKSSDDFFTIGNITNALNEELELSTVAKFETVPFGVAEHNMLRCGFRLCY